jgi:Uma2 family endonuclease
MAVQERLITVDEFWEIAQRPDNRDKRLELIDGRIHEVPPTSSLNSVIAARFGATLSNYVDEHDLGWVSAANGGYNLDEYNARLPRTAYISRERYPKLTDGPAFPVAPDLAVEVVLPNASPRDVLDKTRAYLQAGTKLVWNVYPLQKVVDVCRLGQGDALIIATLKGEAALDGGDTLPGLSIPLPRMFKDV